MQKLIKGIVFVLLLSILFFVVMEGLIIYYGRSVIDQPVDYIIVLGAKIWGDEPSPTLRMRLDAAFTYWQKFPTSKLIVSGGIGADEAYTEAFIMKEYLVDKGIPAVTIMTEETSSTTYENLRNSFAMIPETATIGVVSSSSHLFRANMLSQRLGRTVKLQGAPMPSSVFLYQYIREVPAFLKSFLFDRR